MNTNDKVRRLYIDHKGQKHLSLQSGTVVSFTTSYGYPAAIVRFDEYKHASFTLRECVTTNLIEELEITA